MQSYRMPKALELALLYYALHGQADKILGDLEPERFDQPAVKAALTLSKEILLTQGRGPELPEQVLARHVKHQDDGKREAREADAILSLVTEAKELKQTNKLLSFEATATELGPFLREGLLLKAIDKQNDAIVLPDTQRERVIDEAISLLQRYKSTGKVDNSIGSLLTPESILDLKVEHHTNLLKCNITEMSWAKLARKQVGLVTGDAKSGKCLGKGTPVMFFDGSIKPVEDIKVGDLLMGPDSLPRRVLTTNQGVGPLYRITPNKGASWVCNDAHILTVRGTNKYKERVRDIPVKELLQIRNWKIHWKVWRTGVEFPEQTVEMEPYFVGLWLGDGTKGVPAITNQDQEILAYCKSLEERHGMRVSIKPLPEHNTNHIHFCGLNWHRNPIKHFIARLSEREAKYIPQEYLINSRKNRLELLAGLIDTDGHFNSKKGDVELTCKDKSLMDQVVWLCRSLGFSAYPRPKIGEIKKLNFKGLYYRISINGDLAQIPCKTKQLGKAQGRKWHRRAEITGFRSITPIGEGEYFGFTVDSDARFLLGDFTVTHNSFWMSDVAAHALLSGLTVFYASTEPGMSEDDIKARVVAAITEIRVTELFEKKAAREQAAKIFVEKKLKLGLVVKKFPARLTKIHDILSCVVKAEQVIGRPIDVLIIDHTKFVNPDHENISIGFGNMYAAIANFTQEHAIFTWVAHHCKGGLKGLIGVDDLGWSKEIVATIDVGFSINPNQDKTNNTSYLFAHRTQQDGQVIELPRMYHIGRYAPWSEADQLSSEDATREWGF